jgi:hypothetical protein
MHARMPLQGGLQGLEIEEPDEAALEAPTIDHIWTIKVLLSLLLPYSPQASDAWDPPVVRPNQEACNMRCTTAAAACRTTCRPACRTPS